MKQQRNRRGRASLVLLALYGLVVAMSLGLGGAHCKGPYKDYILPGLPLPEPSESRGGQPDIGARALARAPGPP